MFLILVKVAHCQQVGTAGSKRQGYTNKWNASVHIELYYVMVKIVCKTHSSVTLREFRKHSQKSLKIVKILCKHTLKKGQFSKTFMCLA